MHQLILIINLLFKSMLKINLLIFYRREAPELTNTRRVSDRSITDTLNQQGIINLVMENDFVGQNLEKVIEMIR